MISLRLAIASGFVLSLSMLAVAPLAAQQPPQYPSPTVEFKPAVGRCLTAEQRKVNDAYNALDRATRPGDEMPFWDADYFVGTWDSTCAPRIRRSVGVARRWGP